MRYPAKGRDEKGLSRDEKMTTWSGYIMEIHRSGTSEQFLGLSKQNNKICLHFINKIKKINRCDTYLNKLVISLFSVKKRWISPTL